MMMGQTAGRELTGTDLQWAWPAEVFCFVLVCQLVFSYLASLPYLGGDPLHHTG